MCVVTHQGLMNCCSCGATSCGQTKPSLPMVMAGRRETSRTTITPCFTTSQKQTHNICGTKYGTGAGLSVPVFSSRVFGVLGLLMISTR